MVVAGWWLAVLVGIVLNLMIEAEAMTLYRKKDTTIKNITPFAWDGKIPQNGLANVKGGNHAGNPAGNPGMYGNSTGRGYVASTYTRVPQFV